ncbi:rab-GTPase-TBC domain-containing protein [Ephemerocybe angulata]|uniref:Rab-GTPase-TBC domain-containing protein n=1 Tax=Ephemerocybe angulata TaxID=980116 RepID=A0A8H6M9R4_9AGAR|nr:rab-GTPase-TBC domain-containing protein [Tulosesus angulatus]
MSLTKSGPPPAEPISLDALLSPQVKSFPTPELSTPSDSPKLAARDSVASSSSFNDIALDDDEATFSPVVLTARPAQPEGAAPAEASAPPRPKSLQLSEPEAEGKNHKKTASTTTIRSSHRLSQDSLGSPSTARRASARHSIEGQQKLQEEFARLQKEELGQSNANGHDASIDWDFWGAVISDYQGFAAERPQELAQAIAKGIPGTLRGMMWQHMAASKDPELEAAYLKLLKETSVHEKAITRDLGRTFPHHAFFNDGQGIGQENLFNVLKAYSLYDTQVGYCQGLPFVVAILLLNMPDEEAFSLLVRLMHVYDLRGHFLPEMPKLQMRLFDRLVEELLPVLHVHFLRQGIKSTMYCSQWFLTMFSYRFPLEIVFRIYDSCLANGIEAIFSFSIQLLRKNEARLLKMKFDEILAFLNNKLLDEYKLPSPPDTDEKHQAYNVDAFVQESVSVNITPFMLDCYRHEYEDLMRETNRHNQMVDELRTMNRQLSQQVHRLTSHPITQNELVKQRLKNEEMEEELVRYKLLYAEAVHRNEDAQSNNQRSSFASMMSTFTRGNSASSGSR